LLAVFLQGGSRHLHLPRREFHLAPAFQAAAPYPERIAGLHRHALATQGAGLGGLLVVVGIAVAAPQVLAMAYLFLLPPAVDTGLDVELAATGHVKVATGLHG